MSIRRGIRAVLIGALVYLFSLIYLPRCGLRIAPDDVTLIAVGLTGVLTILVYRFS